MGEGGGIGPKMVINLHIWVVTVNALGGVYLIQ